MFDFLVDILLDLWDSFLATMQPIFNFFSSFWDYIASLFDLYVIGTLMALWDGFLAVMQPIFQFFTDIFYAFQLAYEIGVALYNLAAGLIQVMQAFSAGLGQTINSLVNYNPAGATVPYNPYMAGISLTVSAMDGAGMNIIPQVMTWALYVATGLVVLSLIRGKND